VQAAAKPAVLALNRGVEISARSQYPIGAQLDEYDHVQIQNNATTRPPGICQFGIVPTIAMARFMSIMPIPPMRRSGRRPNFSML
jgi:hypothetical protein